MAASNDRRAAGRALFACPLQHNGGLSTAFRSPLFVPHLVSAFEIGRDDVAQKSIID